MRTQDPHTRVTDSEASPRRFGLLTATLLVVASMIGTGVFTTTGFLVRDIGSWPAILIAWALGGLFALSGALSYAEIVAALPRSGGEYHIISRIYHPAAGFVAGWISLVVGFSAPIAASALAFGTYLAAIVPGTQPMLAACLLVVALSLAHAVRVSVGCTVQNVFSIAKVVFILGFIVGGALVAEPSRVLAGTGRPILEATLSPELAIGLIFIFFAYSGWNGAAYVAGEVRRPERTLPLALILGTAVVTVLYLGLNTVFILAAPAEALSGVVEIGHVAAVHLFGVGAGAALSAIIALALVSSVSAQVMAGPRVYQTMGEDYPRLAWLNQKTRDGAPCRATALQSAVALLMMFTATFETLLSYIGFTLSLSAGLAVAGVMVLRRTEPDLPRPYKVWGYPATPLLFLGLAVWMVVHTLIQRPQVGFAGLATIAGGLFLWALVRPKEKG